MTIEQSPPVRRPPDRRKRILDAAEPMARRGGYHGFSFRDVAAAVGVKSASIHHHFPTKEDLAEALAQRYAARFLDGLGAPEGSEAVNRIVAGYRSAIRADDQMCLCGIFGAEIDVVPPVVGAAVRDFYQANVDWAARALGGPDARRRAEVLIAGLAGAVLVARSTGDLALYDRVAEQLRAALSSARP